MVARDQTFDGWLAVVKAHLRKRGQDEMAAASPDVWEVYWRAGYTPGAAVREELSYEDNCIP